MPVQALDIIVAIIMIFSGLLAMLRGLTREVLSLTAWALAALLTLLVYTNFKASLRAIIDPPMLSDSILIGVVFIAGLIGFSMLADNVAAHPSMKLDKKIAKLDSMLGFTYGLLRGLILVVIAYLVASEIVERQNLPRWITQARSLYLIESTGDAIKLLAPDNPDWLFRKRERLSTPAS